MNITFIVAYNTQIELTKKFLDAMQKSIEATPDFNYDFILVHGYVDDEEDITHPVVTKFIRVKNEGYCKTINAGLMQVNPDCDYVFLLGNDSFPRNDVWIRDLLSIAQETGAQIIAPSDQTPVANRTHLILSEAKPLYYMRMFPSIVWVMKTSLLHEVGLLDEQFYGAGYYSDDDYCKRVIDKYGKKSIVLASHIILDHLVSQEGKTLNVTHQMSDLYQVYKTKWG
jgi:GT2 family glycosyltransferase